MSEDRRPFWERKRLDELSGPEWEAVCDGCGRCCLHKIEDVDTGEHHYTRVACKLLNTDTARCRHYPERQRHVPDCLTLTLAGVTEYNWLPASCAYRRLAEGRGLAWWHPLVSGDPATVRAAGVSVAGRVFSELRLGHADELEDHLAPELATDPVPPDE